MSQRPKTKTKVKKRVNPIIPPRIVQARSPAVGIPKRVITNTLQPARPTILPARPIVNAPVIRQPARPTILPARPPGIRNTPITPARPPTKNRGAKPKGVPTIRTTGEAKKFSRVPQITEIPKHNTIYTDYDAYRRRSQADRDARIRELHNMLRNRKGVSTEDRRLITQPYREQSAIARRDNFLQHLRDNRIVMRYHVNGGERYITFNGSTIDKLEDILEEIDQGVTIEDLRGMGSDAVDDIIVHNIDDITFLDIRYPIINTNVNTKTRIRGGRFLAYNNHSDYDLTRYQVVPKGFPIKEWMESPTMKHHCLIYAILTYILDNPGHTLNAKNEEELVNLVRSFVKPKRVIRDTHLKQMAKILNCRFKLKKYAKDENSGYVFENPKYTYQWYPRNEDPNNPKSVIKLGLVEDHYILEEKTEYKMKNGTKYHSLRLICELINSGVLEKCEEMYSHTREGYGKELCLDFLEKEQKYEMKSPKRYKIYNCRKRIATYESAFRDIHINKILTGDFPIKERTSERVSEAGFKYTLRTPIKYLPDCDIEERKLEERLQLYKDKIFIWESLGINTYLAFVDTECYVRPKHVACYYGAEILTDTKGEIMSIYKSNPKWSPGEDEKGLCTGYKSKGIYERRKVDGRSFIQFLEKFPEGHIIAYYHNLKYDIKVNWKDWGVYLKEPPIQKDGQYYSVTLKVGDNRVFEFRDSYKLMPYKLSDLTKNFKLQNSKKEFILYDLYSEENTQMNSGSVKVFEDNGSHYEYIYRISDGSYQRIRERDPNTKYLVIDNRMLVPKEILDIPEINEYIEKPTFGMNNSWYYSHMRHLRYYLKFDCKVLRDAFMLCRKNIYEASNQNIDCINHVSISSTVHGWVQISGAYNKIPLVKGNLRKFLEKCTTGGRVALAHNEPFMKTGDIFNLDGNALYPSSIYRINKYEGGFPRGKAFQIPKHLINFINNLSIEGTLDKTSYNLDKIAQIKERYPYFACEIEITRVGTERAIPSLYERTKSGIEWTNDVIGKKLHYDSFLLENVIKSHDIDFNIIQGIGWKKIRPIKLGDICKELYDRRLEARANKNDVMADVLKLMNNSAYGKNNTKASKTKTKIVKLDKMSHFWHENFEDIVGSPEILNSQAIFEVRVFDYEHYNRQHVAMAIVSMAKVVMNEVTYLAEDLGICCNYTDTDSLHAMATIDKWDGYVDNIRKNMINMRELQINKFEEIKNKGFQDWDTVKMLEYAYSRKYKYPTFNDDGEISGYEPRKLIGEDVLQFKSDLKYPGHNNIVGKMEIGLQKKSYFMLVQGTNMNNDIELTTNSRMKGIRLGSFEEFCTKYGKDYDIDDIVLMYSNQYFGIGYNYDLAYGGMPSFNINKTDVTTRETFRRKQQIPGNFICNMEELIDMEVLDPDNKLILSKRKDSEDSEIDFESFYNEEF